MGKPRVLETKLRFALNESDTFEMYPGFFNFFPVKKGKKIAKYNGHNIEAAFNGRIFMPLYQEKGEDGFFLTKPVALIWLTLSMWLRKLNIAKFVHYFPGVTRLSTSNHLLAINRKIATIKTMQVMHLLGFKKEKAIGKTIIVSRHKYDFKSPWD